MTNKKFNAILAKNNIAREVKDYLNAPIGEREPIHISYIISELITIEEFLGEGNQPSIKSILNCDKFRL